MTRMADEPFSAPNRPSGSPRPAEPGELLFEFYVERTKTFYRCELRDHGPAYGVEAQFFDPAEFLISHTFPPYLDPARTSRKMAIAWAQDTRKVMEQGEA